MIANEVSEGCGLQGRKKTSDAIKKSMFLQCDDSVDATQLIDSCLDYR